MLNKQWHSVSERKAATSVDTETLDSLIASVAIYFDFPIALISIAAQKQWFIAKSGLNVDFAALEGADADSECNTLIGWLMGFHGTWPSARSSLLSDI